MPSLYKHLDSEIGPGPDHRQLHSTATEPSVNGRAGGTGGTNNDETRSKPGTNYWIVWISLWTPAFGRIGPTSRSIAEAIAARNEALFPDIFHTVVSETSQLNGQDRARAVEGAA